MVETHEAGGDVPHGADDVAGESPVAPSDPPMLALVYFFIYMVYLFATLEGEFLHWVTMVIIPVSLVVYYGGPGDRLRRALGSFGLRWGSLRNGLGLTVGLGVAVCLFQIAYSRMGEEIVAILSSTKAFVALPFAFVFLFLFTATTEEMFFRGYLQTRLERLTGSRWWGLLLASFLFGLYHLPYAYLYPRWPSSGDWGAALVASFGQGVPGGLILGGLFLYSKRNLMAPLLFHLFVDLLPATTLLKFNGS